MRKNIQNNEYENVTTALLLAAGMGSRLYPLTKHEPKCMTLVNGKSILESMIMSLSHYGFKRLVIVTGHLENCIRDFLGNQVNDIKIEYIFSPSYKTTNNIYSLWMARDTIKEPFLLLESDLIYDESQLDKMLCPDRIAISKMKTWMNGTAVTINPSGGVKSFIAGDEESYGEDKYKTVNIYSFSLNSWKEIIKRLNKQILAGKVNDYYETVFADMIKLHSLFMTEVLFDDKSWYEIDTIEDLAEAEKLFPSNINRNTKIVSKAKKPNNSRHQLINKASSGTTEQVLNVAK